MIDSYNQFNPVQLLDPAAVTADTNGDASADLQFYESLLIVAAVGASGDTVDADNDINLEVEHADDDGTGSPDTWADCDDADLLNSVTGATTGTFAHIDAAGELDSVYTTGYIGGKRHVRVVVNVTGTHTNGTTIGIVGLRGNARHQPAP